MKVQKRHIQLLFTVLFMVFMCIPGFLFFLNEDTNSDMDPLTIYSRQRFYSIKFEKEFEKNYGLKDQFRKLNASISIGIFNSSVQSNKTIMGRENWLFYNDKNDQIFDSYSHRDTLAENEVLDYFIEWEKRWQLNQMNRREYIKVCWPNKASIYPEHLSWGMSKNVLKSSSRIEQIQKINENRKTPLPMFSLTSSMIEHKNNGVLYFKNDSHWNALGAYYAYSDFLSKFEEILQVKAIPLNKFHQKETRTNSGDLLIMQGVDSLSFMEEKYTELDYPYQWEEIESVNLPENTLTSINSNAESPLELLIFRDSFCKRLIPMISEHFSKVTYVWHDYNQEIVERVKAHVVIDAKVERYYD